MAIRQDQWLGLGAIWEISKRVIRLFCISQDRLGPATLPSVNRFPALDIQTAWGSHYTTQEWLSGSVGTLRRKRQPLKVIFSLHGLVTSFMFRRLNHSHTSQSHNSWWNWNVDNYTSICSNGERYLSKTLELTKWGWKFFFVHSKFVQSNQVVKEGLWKAAKSHTEVKVHTWCWLEWKSPVRKVLQ